MTANDTRRFPDSMTCETQPASMRITRNIRFQS